MFKIVSQSGPNFSGPNFFWFFFRPEWYGLFKRSSTNLFAPTPSKKSWGRIDYIPCTVQYIWKISTAMLFVQEK